MAAPATEPMVFTVYEQLRREIQALLQENADLKRIVTQLREQRNQRHNVRGPPGALVPSSAPPILGSLPGPGAGQFPFPGSGSSQDSSLGLSQLFQSQPAGSAGTGSLDSLGLSRMYHSYPWESTRLSSQDSSLGLSRLFQSQPGDGTRTGGQDSSLGLSRLFQSQPGDSTLSSGSLNSSGTYSSSLSFPGLDTSFLSLDTSSFSSSDNGSNVFIESFAPNRSLPVPKQYYHVPQRWYVNCPGGIETGPSGPGPSVPGLSGSAASGPGPSVPGPSGSAASGPSASVPGPSGSAASGPGPSGPSPGGAGSSVPGPSVRGPSGPAPSSAGPSDPSPSDPSPSSSSPSGSSPSGAGPSDPSPSGSSPSGSSPSSSSPSGSSPSDPSPSGSSPSGSSPSDPSPSGSSPSGSSPSGAGPSDPSPGGASPSVPGPSSPSPGGAGPSNDAMQQVVSLPTGQQRFAHYSNRTLAGLRPMPSSDNPLYCQLVGEIAYQLDRRILAHVFPNQRRFYGFTISNIPEKILVAIPNMQDSIAANLRYREMMARLRRFGYNPQMHPLFCEALINTYGVLTEVTRPAVLDAMSMDLLKSAIQEALPLRAVIDGIIVLDCLLEMVKTDGGPIFMY